MIKNGPTKNSNFQLQVFFNGYVCIRYKYIGLMGNSESLCVQCLV